MKPVSFKSTALKLHMLFQLTPFSHIATGNGKSQSVTREAEDKHWGQTAFSPTAVGKMKLDL